MQRICNVKDHPKLQEIIQRKQSFEEGVMEQMKFLQARAEAIQEDRQEKLSKFWDQIKDFLTEKNLFPSNYSHSTHTISHDRDTGDVEIEEDAAAIKKRIMEKFMDQIPEELVQQIQSSENYKKR